MNFRQPPHLSLVIAFMAFNAPPSQAAQTVLATYTTEITQEGGASPVNTVITRQTADFSAITTQTPPFAAYAASIGLESSAPLSISFGVTPVGLELRQYGCGLIAVPAWSCQLYVNPLTSKPGTYALTEYIDYGVKTTVQPLGTLVVGKAPAKPYRPAAALRTRTPIRHLVVIFDENNTFDRYFGTYPYATNQDGTPFQAKPGTPIPENYLQSIGTDGVPVFKDSLARDNPNVVKPFRLGPDDYICTNDHEYQPELDAVGWPALTMDQFVAHATKSSTRQIPGTQQYYNQDCANPPGPLNPSPLPGGQVMGYFDGNSATALWNYAQNFAMSDHFHQLTYGPSTLGHLAVIAATTGPVYANPLVRALPQFVQDGYLVNDMWALYDDCSFTAVSSDTLNSDADRLDTGAIQAKNIGDLLTHARVPWGWFSAGFRPSGQNSRNLVECNAIHADRYGVASQDYSSGTEPFQFFASTSNPGHLPPSSPRMIGSQDAANHQYDIDDFDRALKLGKLPAVSFLKPRLSQSGHGDFSNPIDEQHWLVETINKIQKLPSWKNTAVFIAYDDSDGDYDHVPPPARPGPGPIGYGVRLPFLVVSPWSKVNHIDATPIDHGSVIGFIRYNWSISETLGPEAADQYSGSLLGLFDFSAGKRRHPNPRLYLEADGSAAKRPPR